MPEIQENAIVKSALWIFGTILINVSVSAYKNIPFRS